MREQYLSRSDTPATSAPCSAIPISCQPPIIERLPINMGHSRESPSLGQLEVDDPTDWQQGELYNTFRGGRGVPWSRHIQPVWFDKQEANTPNEGWSCSFRFCETICSSFEPSPGFPRSGQVVCFHLYLGQGTADKLGVLGTMANGSGVELERWSDGIMPAMPAIIVHMILFQRLLIISDGEGPNYVAVRKESKTFHPISHLRGISRERALSNNHV